MTTSPSGLRKTTTTTTVEPANDVRYYPVGLSVGEKGTWKLELSAGKDAGCVSVKL